MYRLPFLTSRSAPSAARAAQPVSDQHRQRRVALAVLCAAALIINLDSTILNVALPTLVRDLHATTSQLQWIVDSYAMVLAGLLLSGGSLADRFGRRRFFIACGLAVFAAGSGGAALAAAAALIAGRAVMGVGAALTIPSSLSIISDLFRSPADRARAIGAWAATIGLGIALGPIAGGLLLGTFWWGSIFLVNIPIAAAAIAGALLVVPNSKNAAGGRPDLAGRGYRSPDSGCYTGRSSKPRWTAGRPAPSPPPAAALVAPPSSQSGRRAAGIRC